MIDGQVYTEEVVPVTENPETLGRLFREHIINLVLPMNHII